MKIAIHHRPGSFSDRWIEYCEQKGIAYKIVNAYDSDIINQLADCDAFMWHHHHAIMADTLFAKQLIYSLESKGVSCFPDFYTTWHFDDKVGQKYLLEAVDAPIVPSYVFYNKGAALKWLELVDFPKVFKLRGGAGAANVRLVRSKREAKALVNKAFGKGFPQKTFSRVFTEDYRRVREKKMSFYSFFKDIAAYLFKSSGSFRNMHGPEKGYVYFQDFIPNNKYDIRVCVVGDKAFYLKRMVRKGDFRASGSGSIVYEKDSFTEQCVKIAFQTSLKIKMKCTAYDFVLKDGSPLIVEISYGFSMHAYDKCEGYFTSDMSFHIGEFNPQGWMVENLLEKN